jgi:hypothetical protein
MRVRVHEIQKFKINELDSNAHKVEEKTNPVATQSSTVILSRLSSIESEFEMRNRNSTMQMKNWL